MTHDVRFDFVGRIITASITGRVTDPAGGGLTGVTVTVSGGASATTQTDINGYYSFLGLPVGQSYSLAASKPDCTFDPANQTVNNLQQDQTANFRLKSIAFSMTADAYVRDGRNGSTNYGSATELVTAASTRAGDTRWSYIKVVLANLPAGPISSVKLNLRGRLSDLTTSNIPVAAYSVSLNSWSEYSITWKNKPNVGNRLATVTVTGNVYSSYEWDVTSYVAGELAAGRSTVSLALRNLITTNNYATFNSREASSSTPRLVITFQ